ncbi:MAG: PAS domain S-box protein [Brevinematales bacterium]|nr:PAS domain S-box protein [Brevinematales bacterium]
MKRNNKGIVINNNSANSFYVNNLLENMSYVVIGADKYIIHTSSLFNELIGAGESGVTGKDITGYIPAEQDARKSFSEFIDTIFADKHGRSGEFFIGTPEGFRSRQMMVAIPLKDDNAAGGFILILCFNASFYPSRLDTSKAREEDFREMADQIPIGVCIHIDRKFIYVNKAGLLLFRAKNFDEMKGRDIFEFVHPDYRQPVVKRVEYINSQHGEVPFIEEKFLTVDGEVFDVEVFGSSIDYLGQSAVIVFCRGIGMQKGIERRLAESEQKYQSLFDAMLSGFAYHKVIKNKKGEPVDYEFLEANPAYLEMMGLRNKNIIGKTCRELFPETEKSMIRKFTDIGETGKTVRFEHYDSILDRYFEISVYSPERGFFAAVYRDITARKSFEVTLENERDLFNQIVEISPVGLIVLNKNHKVEFINQTVKLMSGITPNGERKMPQTCPVLRISYTDGRAVPDEEMPNELVIKTKKPIRNMTYLLDFDSGIKKYVSINGAPVMNSEGEVDRVVLSVQDISDSTRIENGLEQLIQSSALTGQEFFQAMALGFAKTFELDYVMICMLDESQKDRAKTIALCHQDKIVGNIEYELTGTPCENLSGEKFCVFQSGVRDLFPSAPLLKNFGIEGYGGMPLYSSKGRRLGMLSVMSEKPLTDVSLIEKFASLFAARISSEIERLQMEAERVKIEEQLRQAQKMETIGRLAGGIAHDFNNMLTPIIGYADMILKFDLEPGTSVYESVEELYEAAIRAKNLTRQLLAFGRKQMLILKTVNMNDIISKFFNILRRTIREDIQMKFEPYPELWSIEADVSQIEQILLNLCINAQDAMPKGGYLKIETYNDIVTAARNIESETMHPGDYAVMRISDNGIGIDNEDLPHIFEPFFTTKNEMGTGLGLATVYGIIRQHQGYIKVRSRTGDGTEFEIHFPKTGKDESTGKKNGQSVESLSAADAGEKTILLVEDDTAVRSLTETILKKCGYHVISAAGPVSAKELFYNSGRKIDLLLTDVVMPDMNGQDLHNLLKLTNPGLKALFMSGYTGNLLDIQGFKFSEEEYIQKPFSMNQLIEKIRGIM